MWSNLKNETKKVFIGYVGYLVLATVVGGTFGKVLAVFGLVIGVFGLWVLISTFEENYPKDDMSDQESFHFRLAEQKRLNNLSWVACSLFAVSCLVLATLIPTESRDFTFSECVDKGLAPSWLNHEDEQYEWCWNNSRR